MLVGQIYLRQTKFTGRLLFFYLSVPLTQVKDVELEFLLELDLDIANDEERVGEIDVDPPVIPPHLIHLGHVWGHTRLLDLELIIIIILGITAIGPIKGKVYW